MEVREDLTKRWSEPPPRFTFSFQMIKTVSIEATPALGGGRSAPSLRSKAHPGANGSLTTGHLVAVTHAVCS